ncbi:hypothetical protein [Alkalicoccobacillus murimartini]|uniref:Uncharacterized protein YacL n=1 Tax=Alkalicoccobacillus murimartini TaxID=171685 RepID=A0ABT9YIL8_9BACI|nr:hypothetical protein [Alkalicoccobacillus murimartini]MDQ0207057.1 uncharacterized protein YacL [Alkalicoccobacillus murimartini]
MVERRHMIQLTPLLFILFLLIIGAGWMLIIGWGVVITIISILGYYQEVATEREPAKKYLIKSICFGVLIIAYVSLFPYQQLDLSVLRRIVVISFILILAAFNIVNSYIWYKKEQQELLQEENFNG